MNKVYWSITGFSVLVIIFTLSYYISFQNTSRNELKSGQQSQVERLSQNSDSNQDGLTVDVNQGDVTRTDVNTRYVEENYDIADAIYQDREATIPTEYVGLTRYQLQAKLRDYIKQPSTEDVKKGLVSVTLNAFSKTSITIRKVYDNKENYAYFLTERDGYVVVYTNDKKTLVDQTGIPLTDLSKEEQQEVKNGVYIDDLDQLYGMLENYTS